MHETLCRYGTLTVESQAGRPGAPIVPISSIHFVAVTAKTIQSPKAQKMHP
ncbi:hypothetical protein [Kitasatospora sp. NRRL B-11411]|uniref:hypothetical protein n=1 Tax=Kitasatospora sp. NRRL B-11411 TaxID=1463822 RepID=UPI000B01958F|nr:hypothetical protein [Kitasatospora sp. NRRL B-11411]